MARHEIRHDSQAGDDGEATARWDAEVNEGAPEAADCVDLDALLEEDDDIVTLAETIVDRGIPRPDDLAVAVQNSILVRDLVARLAPETRRVLFLRYGFVAGRTHSVVEIARILGIFPTSVERIEQRALSRLRRWSRAAFTAKRWPTSPLRT